MSAEVVNGYQIISPWDKTNAQGGEYTFARKDGTEYFIKKLREPIFPKDDATPAHYQQKQQQCETFRREKQDLINALAKVAAGGGNIVAPSEIFLHSDRHYHMITRKVDTSSISLKEISELTLKEQFLLLKTLMASMRRVHSVKVIHGDLKPENILISRTPGTDGNGKLICKIIDFDDSYFEERPPKSEDVVGTEMYWSPELAIYKMNPDREGLEEIMTCKSDIFALGLIFHQYLTGGSLPELKGNGNAYQAVANGVQLKADATITPVGLQGLINDMLRFNPEERPSSDEVFARLLKIEQESEEGSNTFMVNASVAKGNGRILVNGQTSITVTEGTKVKISVAPDRNYELEYVMVNGSRVNEDTFEATGNMEVRAYFKASTFTINASVAKGNGQILVNGQASISVPEGTKVKISVAPDRNYELDYVMVNGSHVNEDTFEATGNMEVRAYFKAVEKKEDKVPSGKYPIVEPCNGRANRVKVTFEDGKVRIVDKWIAEEMGWLS